MTDFHEFPKIARYSREAICTEKLDGTCSLIYIGPSGEFLTGSRKRWITPADDNFGFAAWAQEHKDELLTLGPGRHFGECDVVHKVSHISGECLDRKRIDELDREHNPFVTSWR